MLVSQSALRLTGELAAWATRRRKRMRVTGASMEPTLRDGDHVLVDRRQRPGVGDLAIATAPDEPGLLVIKRVTRVDADGAFWLVSDNPEEGTDSRRWGPVPSELIRGRATFNLSRSSGSLAPSASPSWVRWLRR